jgi:hypothetical protein
VRLRSLLVLLVISLFLAFAVEPAANLLARRGWRGKGRTATGTGPSARPAGAPIQPRLAAGQQVQPLAPLAPRPPGYGSAQTAERASETANPATTSDPVSTPSTL